MQETFYNQPDDDRSRGNFWHTINRVMMVAILLGLCFASTLLFIPVFKQRAQDKLRISQLQAEIDKQKALFIKQTRQAKLLQTDPEYIALMARDRLNLMKSGEIIVRLDTPTPKNR